MMELRLAHSEWLRYLEVRALDLDKSALDIFLQPTLLQTGFALVVVVFNIALLHLLEISWRVVLLEVLELLFSGGLEAVKLMLLLSRLLVELPAMPIAALDLPHRRASFRYDLAGAKLL